MDHRGAADGQVAVRVNVPFVGLWGGTDSGVSVHFAVLVNNDPVVEDAGLEVGHTGQRAFNIATMHGGNMAGGHDVSDVRVSGGGRHRGLQSNLAHDGWSLSPARH